MPRRRDPSPRPARPLALLAGLALALAPLRPASAGGPEAGGSEGAPAPVGAHGEAGLDANQASDEAGLGAGAGEDAGASEDAGAGAGEAAGAVEGPTQADAGASSVPTPPPAIGMVEAPAYRGTGLMVTSALVAGVGMVQQIISYTMIGGTCGVAQKNIMTLQTFDGQEIPIEEGTELAAGAALFGLACVGAAGPALTMRMQTPLYLGAAVGLGSAGGLARGRSNAFEDAMLHGRDRSRRNWLFRVIGGAMVGGGVFLWASSRLGLIGNKPGCTTLNCLLAYDLVTLQGSGALTITGAVMLSSGLAYKRHYGRYVKVRDLGATPFAGRSSFGVAFHGSF